MSHYDVVVIGSGFAGSVLARCLRSAGKRVLVLERGEHPRFALGESSTPLANLCLERLALRYGLDDLYWQAAWGRWQSHLRRRGGLKRGFTFFAPAAGECCPPRGGLWVAASPDDASADSQWLRSSVDAALVERARTEGVEVLERASLVEELWSGGHWQLVIDREEGALRITADFLVDATGGARFASRRLGAGEVERVAKTRLVFGHWGGVPEPPTSAESPYPSAWSAVHYLLGDAWMYELRFADNTVSAGVLTRFGERDLLSAESFATALEPWPWLARRFDRTPQTWARSESIAYRARTAVGDGWAALPHSFSFVDPLFSTGIAWSLLGVERLAELLTRGGSWSRYEALLQREATHFEALIDASYDQLDDFDRFADVARHYFVAASFHETCQRLLSPAEGAALGLDVGDSWCWSGLLGATDDVVARATARLAQYTAPESDLLAARDVAGFSERRSAYAVDLEPLRQRASLLGLSGSELERRLPKLFSPASFDEARNAALAVGI